MSHPHNTRARLYSSLDEIPADVIEAYDAGRMLIPRSALSGPTGQWTRLDWINACIMPEPPPDTLECLGFTWHRTGETDGRGHPLYRADIEGSGESN